ncbi:hypothetical protein [Actinoalloteichus caeruleus]|uniref:hypothetical protein n=1 Tax=Actinoalloteichus cyanogriseus TaxID=2893586 RepID=UPI0004AA1769|nr:hypothetical protein [Actinoalloteichus caeruleus]
MDRYVFYDRSTGAVRHTHTVLDREGRSIEVEPDELTRMVSRAVDLRSVSWLRTAVTPISSRVAERRVDLNTGELSVHRMPRPTDRAERRRRHRLDEGGG